MKQFKIGDKVRIELWNGTYEGTVTQVFERCLSINHYDSAGRSITADFKVVTKLPDVTDIGYATWLQ
jgi:hypothetical protein